MAKFTKIITPPQDYYIPPIMKMEKIVKIMQIQQKIDKNGVVRLVKWNPAKQKKRAKQKPIVGGKT